MFTIKSTNPELYWDIKGMRRAFTDTMKAFYRVITWRGTWRSRFNYLLRFGGTWYPGKCPHCKRFNFIFYVACDGDEGSACWICWNLKMR